MRNAEIKKLKKICDAKFEGSNRIVYKLDNSVYKIHKNPLGAASSRNELDLHDKSFLFPKVKRINNKIIKIPYINNEKLDFKKVFNLDKKNLTAYVDCKYLLQEKYKKRVTQYSETLNKNNESFKNFIPNAYVKELVRVCVDYSIEPCDLINGLVENKGKPMALDFGLTERAYFDHMFIIHFEKKKSDGTHKGTIICMKNSNNVYEFTKPSKITAKKLGLKIKYATKQYNRIKPVNNILRLKNNNLY